MFGEFEAKHIGDKKRNVRLYGRDDKMLGISRTFVEKHQGISQLWDRPSNGVSYSDALSFICSIIEQGPMAHVNSEPVSSRGLQPIHVMVE